MSALGDSSSASIGLAALEDTDGLSYRWNVRGVCV